MLILCLFTNVLVKSLPFWPIFNMYSHKKSQETGLRHGVTISIYRNILKVDNDIRKM